MRKTFSFLMTLVLMGFATVANAGTKVVYSWESPNGTVAETGGTAKAYVDEARVNYKNKFHEADSAYTICLSGKSDFSTTAYVEIVLSEALAEGDQFVVTAYRNKGDNTRLASMAVKFGENATLWKPQSTGDEFNDVGIDNANPNTVTFTVPAEAIGATTIKMSRDKANTNLFITKLQIVREVPAPKPCNLADGDDSMVYRIKYATEDLYVTAQVGTNNTVDSLNTLSEAQCFQFISTGNADEYQIKSLSGLYLTTNGGWNAIATETPASSSAILVDAENNLYIFKTSTGHIALDAVAAGQKLWSDKSESTAKSKGEFVIVEVPASDLAAIAAAKLADAIAALEAVITEAKGYEAAALADAISAAEAAVAAPTEEGLASAQAALKTAIGAYKISQLKSDWLGDQPSAGAFYLYSVSKGQWGNKVSYQWGTEFGTTDTRDLTITLSDVEGLWKFVASSNTDRQIGLDGSEMYVDINNQGNSFYTFERVETADADQYFYTIYINFKDGTKTGYLYASGEDARIRVQGSKDEKCVFQLISTTSPELAAAELKDAIAALEAVIAEAEGYEQESLAAAIADAKAAVAAPTAEGLSAAQAALEAAIAAYKSTLLTSPWTGSVPETGTTYYIYNVASGKFLIGANEWGTQASLMPQGSPFIASVSEAGIRLSGIATNGSNKHYLGNNMYVDSTPYDHKIQAVEGHPTWFTIEYYENDQTKFASYDGSSSVVAGATAITENSYWQFVTREEFCSAATAEGATYPFDMTMLVNDFDFSRNVFADTQSDSNKASFWTDSPKKGGPNGNMCAEKYNTKYDVYQTIEGLPAGWYEVSAQGFYRHGQTADAATDTVVATFYANGASTPMKSILSEDLATVPNSMNEAAAAFAEGRYCLDTLKVAVGADGKLTIGFKKSEAVENDWTIFDAVRLAYVEPLAESDVHASGVIADMKPGKYYIYFTDAEGKDHFLNAAAANDWVASADPVTVELSAGNVTDAAAYGRFASFMASNGYYMSNAQNSDGSGYIKTETINGSNGSKKRTWESQVFYQLGDKYAIRLTNNTGTSWGANCFANVDSVSFKVSSGNPSLGDALYVWSIADENDPKFSTGALQALIEKAETLGDAMNGAVKASLDSIVAVAKAATVADVATVKPALEAAYAAAVASVAEYESLAKAIATANTIYVDIAGGAASFKEAIDAAQAAYDGRTADASTITAMSAASDSYLKLNELNGYLVNGDFEAATTKEGWVDEVETIGTGNHNKWNHVNNHFVEKWVSSGALADFEFNQTIKGLPAGTYAIGSYINACLQSEPARVVKGVSLYANSDSVAVHGFNIDGTDAQKAQGPDYYFVITTIAEGDSIKFGISVKGTDANWVVADNFKLYSFNEATAVLAFIDEAKALIAANPAVGGVVLADLQAQIDNNTGIEAVVAAMDAFKAAIPSYTKLATLEAEYDAVEAMADANAAAKAALTDVAGTYEGVDAAYEVYVEAVFQYRFAVATVEYSCDMTDRYVVNADMSAGDLTGWDTYAAANGWGHDHWQYQGNTNTNGSVTISKYIECWGKSANIGASYAKQSVDSIPNGLYRFSADLVATVQKGSAGKAAVKEAYIFANGDSVAVATADGAPEHFEVYTLVADGAVTFGFCSTDSSVVDWIGFDNAKLEYCGTSAQIIGISVDASSLTLGEGESAQLTAEVSAVGEVDKTVTWTSSNESVATVDNTGKVTAILASDEVVTITAKAGSFTATTAVKVGVTAHTYEFRQWTEEQLAAMEAAKTSKYFTKLTDYYKSGDALESAVLAPADTMVIIPDLKWTVGKGNLRLYFGETIAANYIYFNAAGSVTVPNPYKGMTVTANINGVDSVIVKATTEKEITIELAKKDQLYWIQVDEVWVPTYKEFTEDVVFMTTTDNMAAAYAEGWAANEDAGSNFQMNAKKKYTIDPATDETVDATKCDGFIIKNNAAKMVHFYVKNVKEVVVYAVNSSSDDARDLKVSAEGQTASATAEGGATVKASVATTQGAEVDVKIEASGDMVVYAVKFIYGADSIEEALIDMASGEFYDLTGRKVAEPVSGSIYIVNGKKVLVK